MDEKLIEELRRLVLDLVGRRYSLIEADGRGGRVSADELQRAVEEYGRILVPIPQEGWSLVETVDIENALPRSVWVEVPLWTVEEGRSDLSLEVRATQLDSGYAVEIQDLHVL